MSSAKINDKVDHDRATEKKLIDRLVLSRRAFISCL